MHAGLFNPQEFRDNCGFGLLAHMQGQASHELLQTAIESLTCMTHRGGIAADGKTGDGCGLLIQRPDAFLRSEAKALFNVELGERYAVGMVFMHPDTAIYSKGKAALAQTLTDQGLEVVGWREVPVNPDCLGPMALACMPRIEQIFVVGSGLSEQQFAVKLFTARRKAEIAVEENSDHFYICSLAEQVLSYKGLMMPVDLPSFYPDLGNPLVETAIVVFHQRFSTNTMPRWPLAQPFRFLAHNGEINTIQGNRNWARARAPKFQTDLLPNLEELQPVVNITGSDSSSMDNMLDLLLTGGMDVFRAVRTMIPPAWQNVEHIDSDLKAFYELNSMHMEPWDGPAGVVLTDGRYAICLLDRNGLRPARWMIHKNGYITLASEIGVWNYKPEDVISKGRVGPGRIMAVDTHTGEFLETEEIDNRLKSRYPYKQWLKKHAVRLRSNLQHSEEAEGASLSAEQLSIHQKMFQVTREEREQVLRSLAETGQEAVGSMGDDAPMAVLSTRVRPMTDYFRQQFAQVTNPPIDPIRESIVMSLETCLGPERNLFNVTEDCARRFILSSPVLSPMKYQALLHIDREEFSHRVIDITYDASQEVLKDAVIRIADLAEQASREGVAIVILSDRNIEAGRLPVPAAMATGAAHHRLVDKGLRCNTNVVLDTGAIRDPHQFAVVIGFGATAVYPYLAYEVLDNMIKAGDLIGNPTALYKNYRKGIDKGLFKIMSKMGISTVASYRGAQLFEAVGLSSEVVGICFKGVTSRIEGARFEHFEQDLKLLAKDAFKARKPIRTGGLLKYVHDGEYHAFNPDVVMAIQDAVQNNDAGRYRDFAALVNERHPATLRDLFALNPQKRIPVSEVESAESLLKRFDTAAMSLGALSPEAHEALAVAMNEMGGRSNSGEGGEDPARHGTIKRSKIKQVASGRFGVTAEYLVNAEVIQIKVAQGAKPGEGGQLPGGKVNKLIATLRFAVPGVTLISPPPHHDIYSIEDLAQLIFDLKQVNPEALISVKLVSEPGVGTVAAGVAKAYADLITISGYDGGTAASPLTSIKHAGSPWELGLSEAHQTLRGNDLRDKVRLQTDGGLKTGMDVIKAAILGAESFGFGTIPMVALGCKYLRICHLNNCATGVATQDDALRANHFRGTVEMVKNYFHFVAEEVRELLAELGFRTLEEIIGHTELLTAKKGVTDRQACLDLSPILFSDPVMKDKPHTVQVHRNQPFDQGEKAEQMVAEVLPAIAEKSGGTFSFDVCNCDRSIGARVSGEIARRYGNQGMVGQPITLNLSGVAGQSFGVWNAGGLHMILDGDANDYVGKGMTGGKLVIRPPKGSSFSTQETSIIGNTCLYGATGGHLYAAGTAGERFAVRNSGAHAVVEGAGDHCCEYMTGGMVAVLGKTGGNFGAGMTGGFAFVLDLDNRFPDRYNRELVDIHRVSSEAMEDYRKYLYEVVAQHTEETRSAWGAELLDNFDDYVYRFWLVKPKAASLEQLLSSTRARPE